MSRFLVFVALLCLYSIPVMAQGFQSVFPGLSGQPLLDSLFTHYRPDTVLPYANARDTLYAKVLAIDDDSVRCIYSGHTLYLDPTQDPTQYIYLNGSTLGMNAEHAYPQSKGASTGNARSDMHHLYPARIPVNEARSSLPYADIPDTQTQKWFWKTQILTSTPTQYRDLYAESTTTQFEPREAAKGDVARSVFYFYTMYRNQANIADPNFFELQRATLCQWNIQDPADSSEMIKTWRIAPYQDGKPNPYVLDCTLAQRTWCPNTPPNCSVATHQPATPDPLRARLVPQPAHHIARLEVHLPFSGDVRGTLRSVLGQEWGTFQAFNAQAGSFTLPLDLSGISPNRAWVGFLEVELRGPEGVVRQVLTVLGE